MLAACGPGPGPTPTSPSAHLRPRRPRQPNHAQHPSAAADAAARPARPPRHPGPGPRRAIRPAPASRSRVCPGLGPAAALRKGSGEIYVSFIAVFRSEPGPSAARRCARSKERSFEISQYRSITLVI